ncbi:hypothetical protein AB1Y20_001742 [Prymnesium parvum]|uniref:EF-hand domain-containing protein n=1 Tax=Prymnesium parvum TaxID=97485 RepID=A0AB34KC26_PRYPA
MALAASQEAELREAFDAFDGDGDGLLQADEMTAMLRCCGVSMSEPEVLDMMTEMRPSVRQLAFDDFVHVMCLKLPGSDTIDSEVKSTFPTFSGGKTVITATSLSEALRALGMPVSLVMSDEMVREADLDGDGVVNISDFCAMNNVSV